MKNVKVLTMREELQEDIDSAQKIREQVVFQRNQNRTIPDRFFANVLADMDRLIQALEHPAVREKADEVDREHAELEASLGVAI